MNTISNSTDFDKIKFIIEIINCSIYFLCSVLSTLFNSLLIISWLIYCQKENYADFILISNAITDLINGFIANQWYYLNELKNMNLIQNILILNHNFEDIVKVIDQATLISGFFLLLMLSIHRFKQLVQPFKENPKITRLRLFIIFSILVISLIFSFIKRRDFDPKSHNKEIKDLILTIVFIDIPLILILIINFLVIKHFMIKLKEKHSIKNNFKNEKKAISCTIAINFNILLTNGLLLILNPFSILKFKFIHNFHKIHEAISYFYIVLDPLIIFYFNQKFRRIFLK